MQAENCSKVQCIVIITCCEAFGIQMRPTSIQPNVPCAVVFWLGAMLLVVVVVVVVVRTVHVMAEPPISWYDAVDFLASGAHVSGLLEALETKPDLHVRVHVSAVPVCLPCSGHLDGTISEFSGNSVGRSHVSSSHALCPPSLVDPVATTP